MGSMTTLADGDPERLPPHRRTQSRPAVPRAVLVGLLWTLAVAGFGVLTVPVPRAIASDYDRHGSPSYVFDSSVVSTTLAEVPRAATLVTTPGDAGRSGPATSPLAFSFATKGGKEMSGDQKALKDLVDEATHGGRKPLSGDDADTVLDWADEVGYPGVRAKPGDVADPSNWTANPVPHIHVPGTGRGGHVPVEPGVRPR